MGSLLLAFGMLTVFAPPVESHTQDPHYFVTGTSLKVFHAAQGNTPQHTHNLTHITQFFAGDKFAIHPEHFAIEWIRIYKNPKITSLDQLTKDGAIVGKFNNGPIRIIRPANFGKRRARLYPSLVGGDANKAFWVDIEPGVLDPGGGGLKDDPEKPGNSGRVEGPGVTVVPGDIVAIAIRVKLKYYRGNPEFTAGMTRRTGRLNTALFHPTHSPAPNEVWTRNWGASTGPGTIPAHADRLDDLAGGAITAAVNIDGVGRLHPNYPLESFGNLLRTNGAASPVTHDDWGHEGEDGYHTLVYQFTVTPDHEVLNTLNDGKWLDGGPIT